MEKIKTTHILGIITLVDLTFGSKGMVSLVLWVGYAIYKDTHQGSSED